MEIVKNCMNYWKSWGVMMVIDVGIKIRIALMSYFCLLMRVLCFLSCVDKWID